MTSGYDFFQDFFRPCLILLSFPLLLFNRENDALPAFALTVLPLTNHAKRPAGATLDLELFWENGCYDGRMSSEELTQKGADYRYSRTTYKRLLARRPFKLRVVSNV